MADGYGLHDEIYTQYLRYVRLEGDRGLITANQHLSLTDQLRLGVRHVELDVHWVQGQLRIAHCGGLHSARLDWLVGALSAVAGLFGHPPVQWDAETVGCDPPMSSLPAREQRLFADAVAEVAGWLGAPGNEEEFLVLYLDNQPDLATWGLVGTLLDQVTAHIPAAAILTPAQLQSITLEQGEPPSIEQLVRQYGKRVLLQSGTDYGAAMSYLAHPHWAPCGFAEPLFQRFSPEPSCAYHLPPRPGRPAATLPTANGRMLRSPTCRLSYGLFNCSMQRGENTPQLDAQGLPSAVACGLSVPAPDALTPALAAAAVWGWAPGHPPEALREGAPWRGVQGARRRMQGAEGARGGAEEGEEGEACAVLRSGDGRWVVAPCHAAAWVACRLDAGPQHLNRTDAWTLVRAPPPRPGPSPAIALPSNWLAAAAAACPPGYVHGAPHTARENADLARLAAAAAEAAAEAAAAAATEVAGEGKPESATSPGTSAVRADEEREREEEESREQRRRQRQPWWRRWWGGARAAAAGAWRCVAPATRSRRSQPNGAAPSGSATPFGAAATAAASGASNANPTGDTPTGEGALVLLALRPPAWLPA
ncbi:hypothetical protein HYH03_005880 [Edaphochlamys debaryana]|uniref:Uncharacterized protein n=1 Tax=Edaphochlamys debaryana TaxID=47281 RepID=A0A835YBQ6_9CHLO|nr:hypothetical protein HYH03_005880 [Edaphochlamys debaryana]|eukprot:KAG2495950.1 hypothetical protein HYH03_005880 [Edaphochlamys debaryana]